MRETLPELPLGGLRAAGGLCGGSVLGPGGGIGRLSRGLPCLSGPDSFTPLAVSPLS